MKKKYPLRKIKDRVRFVHQSDPRGESNTELPLECGHNGLF
jgi:hypothetical protein